MRTFFLPVLVAIVSLTACCDKDDNPSGNNHEFLVFGHFYGECGGEGCVEIYTIEDGKLYEDTRDQYPGTTQIYMGEWVELPASKYALVKDLVDDVPAALLNETERVIGQPDAGDWGGIYVQVEIASQSLAEGFWLLDKNENNMNAVYNEFVDKIEAKIQLINQ